MCRVSALVVSALWLAACGGAPPRAEEPRPAPPPAQARVEPAPEPRLEGTIPRAELDAVLAQGFGRFLQRVSTEPHLEGGRFVGFRVVELRGDLFRGVDLRPGDTLLRVNGLPIERPEEALTAWNGLRVASQLTVDYLRQGERRRLRFEITD